MDRRGFITGLTGLLCAPAIVRVASLDALPVGKRLLLDPHVDFVQIMRIDPAWLRSGDQVFIWTAQATARRDFMVAR